MPLINLYAAWFAILAGLVSGAGIGTFFHREEWLGGYGAWRRRMLRLAHISLVGTGLLNLAFALSADSLHISPYPRIASALFLVGAAAMPLVCFLAAWRSGFRQLFFLPVLTLVVATADFIYEGLLP
jgi:hypothetical protein